MIVQMSFSPLFSPSGSFHCTFSGKFTALEITLESVKAKTPVNQTASIRSVKTMKSHIVVIPFTTLCFNVVFT